MSLNLPRPPAQYDSQDEAQTRSEIEQADTANRKVGSDVDIKGARLILTSADGTRFNITVSNAGAIVVTSL